MVEIERTDGNRCKYELLSKSKNLLYKVWRKSYLSFLEILEGSILFYLNKLQIIRQLSPDTV